MKSISAFFSQYMSHPWGNNSTTGDKVLTVILVAIVIWFIIRVAKGL